MADTDCLVTNKKVMICVESLQKYKNTLHVIRSLHMLRDTERGKQLLQDWRLWIVGEGPEHASLEKYVREQGLQDFVVFWGHQANPWRFMAQAEFFVTASRGDGFMLALVEAVILGVPVLYPDYGVGAADYLHELGVGREFSAKSHASLVDAIAAEIAQPTRIVVETTETVREMFSVARLVEKYRKAAESVCPRE